MLAERSRARKRADAEVQVEPVAAPRERRGLLPEVEQILPPPRACSAGRKKAHAVIADLTGDDIAGRAREIDARALKCVAAKQVVHRIGFAAAAHHEPHQRQIRSARQTYPGEPHHPVPARPKTRGSLVDHRACDLPGEIDRARLFELVAQGLGFGEHLAGPSLPRHQTSQPNHEALENGRVRTVENQRRKCDRQVVRELGIRRVPLSSGEPAPTLQDLRAGRARIAQRDR